MRLTPIPSMVVDDPPHFLFWEADEMLPSLTIFSVLFMWDMTLLSFVLPVLFVWFFSRVKQSNMRGFLLHSTWWVGIFSMNKMFESGLEREVDE